MSSGGSVTKWIRAVEKGDDDAVRKIWERYFDDLVRLCRKRLSGRVRVQDEEDVVLSAFDSFCRGAKAKRFPDLHDRNNLWKLLVVISARKANRVITSERTQKQGGGRVINETALQNGTDVGLDEIVSHELTPEFAAQVTEEYERLVDSLQSDSQRAVALFKLEGYTNDEIAEKLECSKRSVERKLWAIRTIWSKELQDGE
jgi:RNA polymerase sigma factor (sigma-70 family)